jgi:hypothetical protein
MRSPPPREGNSCRRGLHACTGHIRIYLYVVEQGVFNYPLRVHGPENRDHVTIQDVLLLVVGLTFLNNIV